MVAKQPCGTVAAYRRHKKAGETPCAPCLKALAAKNAARESTQRPVVLCPSCGGRTRAKGLCRACRYEEKRHELGLYDGDWVVKGGVRYWVPWAEDGAA